MRFAVVEFQEPRLTTHAIRKRREICSNEGEEDRLVDGHHGANDLGDISELAVFAFGLFDH